jgi:hypothetical protein
MSKIYYASSLSPSANVNVFVPFGVSTMDLSVGTEALVRTPIRKDGVCSMLFVNVRVSSASACTVNFRKNGSNGNQSITLGSNATGFFQDTTNTDTINSGDLCAIFVNRTGTNTIGSIGAMFEPDDNSSYLQLVTMGTANATANQTSRLGVTGRTGVSNTAQRFFITDNCTAKNLSVYVSVNTRPNDTTLELEVNLSPSALAITVGAAQTGLLEETTASVSLVDGDFLAWLRTTGAGAGDFTTTSIGLGVEYQNQKYSIPAQTSANTISVDGTFIPLYGIIASGITTNEDRIGVPMPANCKVKNFKSRVNTNASSGDTSLTIRKNQSNTSLSFIIPATSTGTFEDTTNEESFIENDFINVLFNRVSGAGNLNIRNLQADFDFQSQFRPKIFFF